MDENERYERAKARVAELRGFYSHATVFVLVNLFLLVINLLTSPHTLWFYWPLLGWGIGLAAHAIGVFVMGGRFGKEWEERKIREMMERDRPKG